VNRAFPILLLASLPGCSTRSTAPAPLAPVPPPLPAAFAAPCPSLPLLANPTIGELVRKDIDAALDYADCARRHAGAVNAYGAAREAAIRWNRARKAE